MLKVPGISDEGMHRKDSSGEIASFMAEKIPN